MLHCSWLVDLQTVCYSVGSTVALAVLHCFWRVPTQTIATALQFQDGMHAWVELYK